MKNGIIFLVFLLLSQGLCAESSDGLKVLRVTKNSQNISDIMTFERLLISVKRSFLLGDSTACLPMDDSNSSSYFVSVLESFERKQIEVINVIEYEGGIKKTEVFLDADCSSGARAVIRIIYENHNCLEYSMQLLLPD